MFIKPGVVWVITNIITILVFFYYKTLDTISSVSRGEVSQSLIILLFKGLRITREYIDREIRIQGVKDKYVLISFFVYWVYLYILIRILYI